MRNCSALASLNMINKVIFLNAGHHLADPGIITSYGREADFNIAVRNALIPELDRQGFEVKAVPDNLPLRESIDWVNNLAKNLDDGLALDIHCNCCALEGAEAYYYAGIDSSKRLAEKLVNEYSKEMSMPNREARPDTISAVGKLAWIGETNCWATLLEMGYLDNPNDVLKIKDYQKTAKAITKGICKIFGIDYREATLPPAENREEIKNKIIELVKKL